MSKVARTSVAVVGSGVSGLTAAYLLNRHHDVTLYESETRLGGHVHTHSIDTAYGPVRVDSGFIVHNDRTYPHLLRLFAELGVQTRPTEMSMSIADPETGLEYAGGRGLAGFVARPRQLLDGDYLRMLGAVRRFHREATAFLTTTDDTDPTTYGAFIEAGAYPRAFVDLYAVPLVSCVWSSGRGDALDYPARYLFRFLDNHGMLSVGNSPQWRTVVGGSATYVELLAARLTEVRTAAPVRSIRRSPDEVIITAEGLGERRHDRVVIATHADDALSLLVDASPQEKEVLGAFRYSHNATVLHTDGSLMPKARGARAAWNYRVGAAASTGAPVVTYWMNRLQGIDERTPLYVTLNATDDIDPTKILRSMDYTHPIHDLPAIEAQRRLPELNTGRTAYAGAYHGWGFHEDGCRSGVEAARSFGVTW